MKNVLSLCPLGNNDMFRFVKQILIIIEKIENDTNSVANIILKSVLRLIADCDLNSEMMNLSSLLHYIKDRKLLSNLVTFKDEVTGKTLFQFRVETGQTKSFIFLLEYLSEVEIETYILIEADKTDLSRF